MIQGSIGYHGAQQLVVKAAQAGMRATKKGESHLTECNDQLRYVALELSAKGEVDCAREVHEYVV